MQAHSDTPYLSPSTIDPAPLIAKGRNWPLWIGPILSLAILGAALYQLRSLDYRALWAMLPSAPIFWMMFAVYYLASPISEWIIFRRLWRLPVEGFAALLGKLVSNEILLGYVGEVYFYAWARRHARITTAPFGALKDVTILVALTGNVVTLLMVVVAVPLFGALDLHMDSRAFAGSTIFVLATSILLLFFRKRLFTLPRRELWIVAGLHIMRIIATTGLAAAMWHIVLPTVPLGWWLLLGTMRQLLSRLPFLPNKDVVFAGLAVFLVGKDAEIVDAMTLMATIILAAHLIVGAAVALRELVQAGSRS